jgi:integrase
MNVTILEKTPGRFRLRIETRDARKKRHFGYETIVGGREDAEIRRLEILRDGVRPHSGRDVMLRDYLEGWIVKRMRMGEISETTAEWYGHMIKYVTDEIGDTMLRRVTPSQIKEIYDNLLDSGLSRRTVKHVHARLVSAFDDAMIGGMLNVNIMKKVEGPTVEREKLNKTKTLTHREVRTLLKSVELDNKVGPIIRLALATGLRRGELCGLQKDDFDFKRGRLTVKRNVVQLGSVVKVKAPKSAAGRRTIHVSKQVMDEIMVMISLSPYKWVFPDSRGNHRLPAGMTDQINDALARAGLEEFTLHDLRHAHATALLQKGLPLKAVSERLGHSDVTITMRTYQHVIPKDDAALSTYMAQFMEEDDDDE